VTAPDHTSRDRARPDGLLARLARLNVTAVFLFAAAYVVVALFAPGIIGGAMLLALAAGLGWLLATTWPVQHPRTRTVRVLILAMLALVALSKIF
jgi:hypothetical protein